MINDQIRLDMREEATGNFAPIVLETLSGGVLTFDAEGTPSIAPPSGGPAGTPPSDLPYDPVLWDGNLSAATKNVLRDKFESLETGGGTGLKFSNIAELQALSVEGVVEEEDLVDVLGYYTPGDGGGGQFRFTTSVAEDGNGGTVIAPDAGAGRWLRIFSGGLSIRCFGARGDGTAAAANTSAFIAAIQHFAAGGTILVPCGTYKIVGGLTWGSSIASLVGEGRYSIIECTAQTGAIIDLSISSLVSDFQFSQQIAHLYLLGDQVADPTKTHCGIRLHGAVTCVSFHHLIIGGTGGACLKLETESDCCSFENITLNKPIGANANNVPWVHLYGVANGNVFKTLILREATNTELSGVGGCIRIEMNPDGLGPGNPYSPNNNKFIACQSEYIHMPPGGSIVHCDGRNNDFDHFIDYDSDAGGTLGETTDTCIIRFPANATFPIGGNLVRGIIPGGLASATGRPGFVYVACGVIISSNGNHVDGVSGGYPNCVLLTVGATRNYVCLAGTSHATYTGLIVDNSAAANAIINTVPTGTLQANKLEVGDDAYNATTWDGNLSAPTKNALRDKIVALEATIPAAGSVATDAIFDAKGDLAVGTGANTAAKLTAGTNGHVLTADSAEATGVKWAASAAGGATAKGYLTSNQPTTSTTAVNITGMAFAIAAGEVWSFQFSMLLTNAAGADTRFALDVPTAATVGAQARGSSSSREITADATLTLGTVNTASGSVFITGLVSNGVNAGTVQLMFASTSGASTTIVGTGSYFTATKMN